MQLSLEQITGMNFGHLPHFKSGSGQVAFAADIVNIHWLINVFDDSKYSGSTEIIYPVHPLLTCWAKTQLYRVGNWPIAGQYWAYYPFQPCSLYNMLYNVASIRIRSNCLHATCIVRVDLSINSEICPILVNALPQSGLTAWTI